MVDRSEDFLRTVLHTEYPIQILWRGTSDEFDEFSERPENEDFLLELIDGEIVEKVPNNALASKIAILIARLILNWLDANNIEGHVTGEGGGFKIGGDRYAPDVAYLPESKQEELDSKGYNTVPPDLVVEVEVNTTKTTERKLQKKIVNYLRLGIVVWVVYAKSEKIEVHVSDQEIVTLGIKDTLNGGNVLPGFSVPLKEIFKSKKSK